MAAASCSAEPPARHNDRVGRVTRGCWVAEFDNTLPRPMAADLQVDAERFRGDDRLTHVVERLGAAVEVVQQPGEVDERVER